ncbi:MAG: AI-2E family transporter [Micrococcaceae bacterium]|nr:AI-2E family transporter [Micrococcaceae bacterium]
MAVDTPPTPCIPNPVRTSALGRSGERARYVLFIVALAAVVVYGLSRITIVVVPPMLALILAATISPLVAFLRKRAWPASLATATAFALLVSTFGALVLAIVAATRAEWNLLASKAGERLDELSGWLVNGPLPIDESTLDKLRSTVMDFADSREASDTAMGGLAVLGELATGFVLMAVILFFFLKDGRRIWDFWIRRLSGDKLAKMRITGIQAISILGGYVRGTAIVAAIDAVLIGAALAILQVPLALPLAVLVFVGAFIPVIGATASGVLAAVVALVGNGVLEGVIVAVVIVAVNQLEGNLLQPVVMGRTLQVHPLVILLALTCGAVLAGILGAILAVPLTAVAWAIIQVWVPAQGT